MESPRAEAGTKRAPDADSVLGGWPWSWIRPVGRQRLAGALKELDTELALAEGPEHGPSGERLALARGKFDDAKRAAGRHDVYLAWDLVQQTHRLLAECRSPEDRHRHFLKLSAEAGSKLGSWRKQAADDLADRHPNGEALVHLMKIMDEAAQNQQQKIELLKEQGIVVLLLLVPALAAVLAYARGHGYDWMVEPSLESTKLATVLLGGFLVGLLGSLMSVAFALSKADAGLKIPQLRSAFVVLLLRAIVGAAASVPVVLMVHAGLIQLGSGAPKIMLVACFIAGFSERWFIERLDKIVGMSNPPDGGKS